MLNIRSEILNTSYAVHSTYQKFQDFIIDLSKIYSHKWNFILIKLPTSIFLQKYFLPRKNGKVLLTTLPWSLFAPLLQLSQHLCFIHSRIFSFALSMYVFQIGYEGILHVFKHRSSFIWVMTSVNACDKD